MMRFSKVMVLVVSILVLIGTPSHSRAEPMREFIMSCSYGVLAGTLVGAATLAFSEKPGDNLNKVARGASFGLYGGILLGLYVVYGVPNQEESEIREQLGYQNPRFESPRFVVAPVLSPQGAINGGEFKYDIVRF